MNKNIVRIVAVMILFLPWTYVSSLYKDVLSVIFSIVLLLATVDISKKKKSNTDNTEGGVDKPNDNQVHSNIESKRQNISTL